MTTTKSKSNSDRFTVSEVKPYNRSKRSTSTCYTIHRIDKNGVEHEAVSPSGRPYRFRTRAGAANRVMRLNREIT